MATSDATIDPATGLRRRVIASLDPSQGADPTAAPSDSTSDTPAAAPFIGVDNASVETLPTPNPATITPAPAPAPTGVQHAMSSAFSPVDTGGYVVPDPPPFTTMPLPRTTEPGYTGDTQSIQSGGASGGVDGSASSIAAYYASRGVTPFATSVDYWASKWPALVARGEELGDPNYAMNRLAAADEFTGVGPNYDWQAANAKDPDPTFTAEQNAPPAAAPPPTPAAQPAASSAPSSFDTYLASLQQQETDRAAQQAQIRKLVMDRISAASQPVNENDQYIAAPLSSARDEVQRSQDAERTALAERLYAQGGGGLDSNALTQQIQQSSEKNAGSLSSLRAGLISQEYTARRQEISTLLSQAMAQGDAESAQQLQAEMAALDAQIKREGLGINLAEFGAQLNQNAALSGLNG